MFAALYGLIAVPSTAQIIGTSSSTNNAASTGAIQWTESFLPEFWVLVGVGVGLLVVGLVVRYIMKNVRGGVKNAFGMSRRRILRRR